ncbi:MAG: hypothetical protein IJ091_09180 [Oscillospiraceae bacterium]|nr:hypothetical protein [Oscillospiraceae bacterium]
MELTINEVLKEEYARLQRMRFALKAEYDALPKGCISPKSICGYECYYLQYREGEKIISKYIKKEELADVSKKVERRRSLKNSLRDINLEMKKIERVVK